MASVNSVHIIGHLGRDPDLRYAPTGAAVCNLHVATSRAWTDKATGDKREETEWHRVVLYDRLAEVAGEYLAKGGLVYIAGRLRTNKWQDKDGNDRYTTEIVGNEMTMLGGKGESQDRDPPKPTTRKSKGADYKSEKGGSRAPNFDDPDDDGIPF